MMELNETSPYGGWNEAEIARGIGICETEVARQKAKIDAMKAELLKRRSDEVKARFASEGKEHGTLSIAQIKNTDGSPAFSVKAEIRRDVRYDSEALLGIASSMTWDQVKALFEIKMSVSSKIYDALEATHPDLKNRIDREARTTKYSDPSLKLEPAKK